MMIVYFVITNLNIRQ